MEYKFRGKVIGTGQWVYGSLIQREDSFGPLTYIEVQHKFPFERELFQVRVESVGQFTGLKDKNGTEIYAGDILKSFSASVPSYEVFYCRSSYRLRYKLKGGEWYDWGPLFRMEEIQWEGRLPLYPDVIGNIHDNPELLNPLAESPAIHTMEPNQKQQEEQVTNDMQQATEQQNAQESAAQDAAVEVDSEEGSIEG